MTYTTDEVLSRTKITAYNFYLTAKKIKALDIHITDYEILEHTIILYDGTIDYDIALPNNDKVDPAIIKLAKLTGVKGPDFGLLVVHLQRHTEGLKDYHITYDHTHIHLNLLYEYDAIDHDHIVSYKHTL